MSALGSAAPSRGRGFLHGADRRCQPATKDRLGAYSSAYASMAFNVSRRLDVQV